MKKPIILIGGGGHCRSCIDVIEQENKFAIQGIVDLPKKKGQKILGYPIMADDSDIKMLCEKYRNFLITLGQIKSPKRRIEIYELLKTNHANLPVIISPLAYVSKHAILNEGTIIMHNAIVNAGANIGQNCIINNKALIEHDCIIKDQTHISTNATINGEVNVSENCFIGSSSVIRNNVRITSNTIIGAGAVVTKDITESGVYVGSPAKRIK